ncbi:DUF2635 domain-containing protein [Hansschlegelia zhihuaiae]|uniref:DUF2635 domain-containing protein n=1 Tax=Hansschlegelia zhihuaiae TaxID=405005 RepID=A0A4Q0M418_9HYPH|nr:DUF2635 domain-containing protein [Hansschlegelia zhihuaiae]RXF67688.1 DUF2635 domain-containing protein [Hansschlegelia zhihuaiae]
MSETKFVKPSVDGARIPDPAMGDDLPAEGRAVRWTPYWRRLEMRGDVIVSAAPTEGQASGDKPSASRPKLQPPARPAAPTAAPTLPGAGGA